MKNFDQHFRNMTRGIPDHEFKHYNEAMGCQIYSKDHYKAEMLRRGMVPADMAEDLSDKWEKDNPRREYEMSEEGRHLIHYFKSAARKGMITLGNHPKAVEAMKRLGMSFDTEQMEGVVNG